MRYLFLLLFLAGCEVQLKSDAFMPSKGDKLADCLKSGVIELDQELKENQRSTGMIKACLFLAGYEDIVKDLRGR